MSTIVMSVLVWGMSAGAAEDGPCRFTDVVTGESRDCLKGPSTKSLPYLYRVDESAWRIAEKFEGKFVRILTKFDDAWVEEDPAYDESTDDQDERDRAFDAWVNLIKILVLIVNGADAYITSLGLTGHYDGIVCNDQNVCSDAYLWLQHQGTAVDGRLLVLDPGMEVDAGICGSVDVPVISLPVHATSSGSFDASGATTREVDFTFFFTGDATVGFDLHLDPTDKQTLTGEIQLVLEDPCADSELTFRFTRRNNALLEM